ncbi:MAG TPA: exodeoxyribonuclease VII small subunit [Candidatus Gallacutalibacter stercoravium]|nr:exodeoxyribonuclease VII small subunit [Candidatus Gallacutalibacter stercoravium]
MSKKLSFEESIRQLEEIVGKLEEGNVSLEESIQLFEQGSKLASQCYTTLTRAEQKITQLAGQEENGGIQNGKGETN